MPKKKKEEPQTKAELEEENDKLKIKLIKQKAQHAASKFKNETKKALSTALIAAFGFILALEWRGVIQEYVTKVNDASPIQGKLISAIIVTIISVIGIIIVTSTLHRKQ